MRRVLPSAWLLVGVGLMGTGLVAGSGLACRNVESSSSAPVPQPRESAPTPASVTAGDTVGALSSAPPQIATGADVVLITIDTLRADALGFAGNARVSTPHLDRLAQTGRWFSAAYAHNVVTLPSHANILTGLYPYQHGVRENSGFKLGDDVPTLATVLKAEGYATGAFVASFPLDARFGLNRGFDVYDDRYPSGSHTDQFLAAERRGDEVVALALDWWRRSAGPPRFLWVHLYDPHAPYLAPEPYASQFPGEPYLAEVSATDAHLGPLLEMLTKAERPPIVVVTSDHGEAQGDHGELTHGLFCYEATLKIPLILWGPGVSPGSDSRLVGHVDIVPTVLEWLGLESNLPSPSGRSLLASANPLRSVYFESLTSYFNRGWAPLRGLVSEGHKMIEVPVPELYNLQQDPAEQENLFRSDRDRFQKLRATLPREASWPPEQRQVSAAETAALRSLGYVGGSSSRRTGFRPEDDPKNLVEIDQKLQSIIIAYSNGQYEQAAELSRQVIAARPEMVLGYEHLALVLRQMERPREAVAVLRGALDKGLTDESLLRQLGLTYTENGLSREAIQILEPFAEGDDIETLNALGVSLSGAGRHEEGLVVLRRALALDPNESKILESLGVVTLRTQRVVEAKSFLEQAIEFNDNLPFSWNTLGVVHAYEGDHAAAIEAWEKSIKIDPRQYDAIYNLGMTAARIGDQGRARRALEQYLATAPPERFAPDIEQARRVLASLP